MLAAVNRRASALPGAAARMIAPSFLENIRLEPCLQVTISTILSSQPLTKAIALRRTRK